jgi:hypothetical protein
MLYVGVDYHKRYSQMQVIDEGSAAPPRGKIDFLGIGKKSSSQE